MAFITIPICYVEVDPDEDDSEISRIKSKSKPPKVQNADVTINTVNICSYVGVNDTNHTMIFMADGTMYECTYERDVVDDIIAESDAIIDLTAITEN